MMLFKNYLELVGVRKTRSDELFLKSCYRVTRLPHLLNLFAGSR